MRKIVAASHSLLAQGFKDTLEFLTGKGDAVNAAFVTAKQAGVLGLAPGESATLIGCHLLESEGREWGYKFLVEAEHPYYYSCPLRYLDMAPVQSSEWRERVHRFHAGRAV